MWTPADRALAGDFGSGQAMTLGRAEDQPSGLRARARAARHGAPPGPLGGGSALPAGPDPAYAAAAFTPNFPAYPSGHATFGAACFDVLRRVRAERAATRNDPDGLADQGRFPSEELDGVSVDNYLDEPRPDRRRRFAAIEEMIGENSESRVWSGVHWKFDADEGEASGKAIAEVVHGRACRRA